MIAIADMMCSDVQSIVKGKITTKQQNIDKKNQAVCQLRADAEAPAQSKEESKKLAIGRLKAVIRNPVHVKRWATVSPDF